MNDATPTALTPWAFPALVLSLLSAGTTWLAITYRHAVKVAPGFGWEFFGIPEFRFASFGLGVLALACALAAFWRVRVSGGKVGGAGLASAARLVAIASIIAAWVAG